MRLSWETVVNKWLEHSEEKIVPNKQRQMQRQEFRLSHIWINVVLMGEKTE